MKQALEVGISVEGTSIKGVQVKGVVEQVLERTVIVRDEESEAHLVTIKQLKKVS